jgi:hypothetical protein
MRGAVVVALVIALTASSLMAAPIPPTLGDAAAREADLATLARALESRQVGAYLSTLGAKPEEIQARLARLDDGELRRMAQSLSEVGVGGQSELTGEQKAGVALLVILAVVVFAGLIYLSIEGF